MKELITQRPLATGHAFVVFQLERDRNRCAELFHREPRSYYEFVMRFNRSGEVRASEVGRHSH